MASISSLSGSTNNAMSSLRGYGGLASGLDRDELIAGMTSGTQTKITKQEQAKTKLEWQQQAYRDISDKMIAFANKYTSTMSSTTNLFSEALWGAASTMVKGINSKFISVAGANRTAAANVSILGVKQMAKNAKVMSDNYVSDRKLSTGAVDTGDVDISTLAGKNLDFTVGGKYYSVGLPYGTGEPFGSMQEAADAFNEAMKKVEITQTGGAKKQTLFDSVEVGVSDDGKSFVLKSKGNAVTLTGGSALEAMGFKEQVDEAKANKRVGLDIAGNTGTAAGKEATLKETQSFAQRMGDKSLTFSYNGSTKTIQMPSQKEIEDAINSGKDGLEFLAEKMQESLDAAFGKGRVQAKVEEDSAGGDRRLTFKTTTPDGNSDDSSTLAITEGSESIMSSYGGLGITSGESNRLNLNTSLKNSGLNFGEKTADGKYELEINGKKIEFTEDESLATIMDRINNADAGVKISYLSMADKFSLEATDSGASGVLKLSGSGAKALFGEEIDSANPTAAGRNTVTLGQDAIIAVKYAGSDEAIELTRGDNSFSIDGLDVTIKGEFGYKLGADGKTKELDETTEAVTFETNVESEKIVKAVSDMVKEYNEILELVNTQLSTRPDRDYFPLTDEQKKEMSESEIKLWEEKAQAGILFGSSELRQLSDDLRWIISPADQQAMEALGISVSESWQDNGKLAFDENKFKAALEKDPDAVKAAFTKDNGIAANLKNTMNKYVNTLGATKGILIEKAGSTHAPLSLLNNSLKTEIDDVDKILENLKARLKSEQDRYISQFTQLETLISQMNSQSSYLSGMGF
ncbi:flagellar filament capping protein FliD [Candidatus Merdisoma sp. JLR.KK011]|uniref:flagellar filament capping protein FliD n=1 Tax=Candidatus Merdisoma sp. JLR.KK011 TaxID=3114299 RepID=UPI002FF2940F